MSNTDNPFGGSFDRIGDASRAGQLPVIRGAQDLEASIRDASSEDPDLWAEAKRISASRGWTPEFTARLMEFAEPETLKELRGDDYGRALHMSRMARRWIADPVNARVAYDDIASVAGLDRELSFARNTARSGTWSDFWASGRDGFVRLASSYYHLAAAYGLLSPEEAARGAAEANAFLAESTSRRSVAGQVFSRELEESDGFEQFLPFITSPGQGLGFLFEQFTRSSPTVVAGAAGGWIGAKGGAALGGAVGGPFAPATSTAGGLIFGTAGAAVAGSAASFALEVGGSIEEDLQKRGVDITDPAAILEAYQREGLLTELRHRGELKGFGVSSLDGLAMLVGIPKGLRAMGRAKVLAKPSILARAGKTAVGLGVESVGEAAGEAFGQLLRDGSIDLDEVVLEAIGGLGQSAAQLGIQGSLGGLVKAKDAIAGGLVQEAGERMSAQQRILRSLEIVAEARLRKRSPESLRDLANSIAEAEGAAEGQPLAVRYDVETWVDLSEARGVDPIEELERVMPAQGDRAWREAYDRGQVEIPLGTFLDAYAGTEQAADVVGAARLTDGGMTFLEAEKIAQATLDAQAGAQAVEAREGSVESLSTTLADLDARLEQLDSEAPPVAEGAEGEPADTGVVLPQEVNDLPPDALEEVASAIESGQGVQEALEAALPSEPGGEAQGPDAEPTAAQALAEAATANPEQVSRALRRKALTVRREQVQGQLNDAIKAERDLEAQVDRIRERYVEELRAAGRSEIMARAEAELVVTVLKTFVLSNPELTASDLASIDSLDEAFRLAFGRGQGRGARRRARRQGRVGLDQQLPDTIDVDGVQRPTRNSEGALIHPGGEEAIRNFWRWFGDSKAVDEQGRPLVVYHGTATDKQFQDFQVFTHFGSSDAAGEVATMNGHLFRRIDGLSGNDTPERVFPVYLRIESPGRVSEDAFNGLQRDSSIRQALASVPGADGLVYANEVEDAGSDSYVITDPTQVKSAIGNTGESSPDSPVILEQAAPKSGTHVSAMGSRWAVTHEGEVVSLHPNKAVAEQRARVLAKGRTSPLLDDALEAEVAKAGHRLSIESKPRKSISPANVKLSKAERDIIANADNPKEFGDAVRATKARFPVSAGWLELELVGEQTSKSEDGEADEKTGKPAYKAVPYTFHQGDSDRALRGEARQREVQKLARRVVKSVRGIADRARAGDGNALVMLRQRAWYSNMVTRLYDEFGGAAEIFVDLLGALSPNTPVSSNWNYAMEAIANFARGNFDQALDSYATHLANGGKKKDYDGPVVLRENSKKFSVNTLHAMDAMLLARWRLAEVGAAPKAKNFSWNLSGWSVDATIDVWAARFLQRLSGKKRVPIPAEQGVGGNWGANSSVTGAFGFGQEVFEAAAAEMEMSASDLQALVWFAEKELWAEEGWSSKQGEGGSFEESLDSTPMDRWIAGVSVERPDAPQTVERAGRIAPTLAALGADKDVIVYRGTTTRGVFLWGDELSFDMELTANRGWSPDAWRQQLREMAEATEQDAFFTARVMRNDEDVSSAAPGLEARFAEPISLEDAKRLVDLVREAGFAGATLVRDPRRASPGSETEPLEAPDQFIGLRVLWIEQWAEGESRDDAIQRLEDLRDSLGAVTLVQSATRRYFDLAVEQKGADYADRAGSPEGGAGPASGDARAGQPDREGPEAADRGGRGPGRDGGGPVDLGTADEAPGAPGDLTTGLRPSDTLGDVLGLEQAEGGGDSAPRGVTLFNVPGAEPAKPRRFFDIRLLRRANKSTVVHELGHVFFEILGDLASLPNAPPRIVRQYQQALQLVGYSSRQDHLDALNRLRELASKGNLTREERAEQKRLREPLELFARLHEAYLRRGEAPTPELRGLFAHFGRWLKEVYEKLHDLFLGPDGLSEDAIEFFDTLYATDEAIQIARAERGAVPLPDIALEGMTDEEIQEYRRLVRDVEDGEENRLQRAVFRSQQASLREERLAAIDAEKPAAAAEVDAQPAVVAFANMARGTMPDGSPLPPGVERERIDRSEVERMYGSDSRIAKRLRDLGVLVGPKQGGLHPDQAAEAFGFETGDELVRAVLAASNRDALIDRVARARVLLNRPELFETPQGMKELARRAVASGERGRLLEADMRALLRMVEKERSALQSKVAKAEERAETGERADAAGETRRRFEESVRKRAFSQLFGKEFRALLEAQAADILSRTPLRAAREAAYLTAAKREARKAALHAQRGEFELAALSKRREMLNHELLRQAAKLQKKSEKGRARGKELGKKNYQNRAARGGPNLLLQLNKLLNRFGLARVGLPDTPDVSLAAWLQEFEKATDGLGPDIPSWLLDETVQRDWKDLTPWQQQDVRDAIEQLYKMGRDTGKFLDAQRKQTIKDAEEALAASIRANSKRGEKKLDPRDKPSIIKGVLLLHRTIDSLAQQMDGGKAGLAYEYLIRGKDRAAEAENAHFKRVSEELKKAFDLLTGEDRRGWDERRRIEGVSIALSLEERIGVALNYGNREGRDRLLNTFDESEILIILGTLEQRHADFARIVWELEDSFWEEFHGLWQSLKGVGPPKVAAIPFQTQGREGRVTWRGGYHRIKYEGSQDSDLKPEDQAKAMKSGRAMRETTRSGSENVRKKNVRKPLRLDFGVVTSHVSEVIHEITHLVPMRDSLAVLRSPKVEKAIKEEYGKGYYDEILKTYEDIMSGDWGANDAMAQAVRYLRGGTVVMRLGLKTVTNIINLSGLTNTAVHLGQLSGRGPAYGFYLLAKQMLKLLRNFGSIREMRRHINELSPGMAQRSGTFVRELAEGMRSTKMVTAGPLRRAQKKLSDYAFIPLAMTQAAVDTPTWMAAFEIAQEQFPGDRQKQIDFATRAVKSSQSSGDVGDLARITRGNEFQKLFTTFMGYMVRVANLTAVSASRVRVKDPRTLATFMGEMLTLYVVPVIFEEFVRRSLRGDEPDDDESYPEALARGALGMAMSQYALLREFSGLARGYMDYDGPVGASFVTTNLNLWVQASQAIADGETDEAFWRAVAESAGGAFHLPTQQVYESVQGTRAYLNGEAGIRAVLLGPPRSR